MYDRGEIIERFVLVLDALERIPRRIAGVSQAEDFDTSPDGQDRLDAICMVLIAVGEALKQIDTKTDGQLLSKYPEIEWRGVIGVRNVIAHGYFDIDAEQVFDICQKDIPLLTTTVRKIIDELR